MFTLKSLIEKFTFRKKGQRQHLRESPKMAQARFINHLSATLKGYDFSFKFNYGSKAKKRGIQSRRDRTEHALKLARIKFAGMADPR